MEHFFQRRGRWSHFDVEFVYIRAKIDLNNFGHEKKFSKKTRMIGSGKGFRRQ